MTNGLRTDQACCSASAVLAPQKNSAATTTQVSRRTDLARPYRVVAVLSRALGCSMNRLVSARTLLPSISLFFLPRWCPPVREQREPRGAWPTADRFPQVLSPPRGSQPSHAAYITLSHQAYSSFRLSNLPRVRHSGTARSASMKLWTTSVWQSSCQPPSRTSDSPVWSHGAPSDRMKCLTQFRLLQTM